MERTQYFLYPLLLLGLIGINFFYPLGQVPLFDLDEGAFSEATREMLLHDDYITTYLNGELRFDKPILIYWLQALSSSLFGLNEFAVRFPSALAATFWALAIYLFVQRFYNQKSAFFAAFIMVTSLQITIIAKAAIADALLNLFIALSMFSLYLYYQERKKLYLYLSFLYIGLGTLTKGPVAILIPLVVTFLFLFVKKEYKLFFQMLFNPIGIALFFVVAAPWYIAEYIAQGEKFIDGFFFKHNMSRFNTSFEGHSGSIFYYIPVLLIGLMPYTTHLIQTLLKIKLFLKNDLTLFLMLWFLFVFLFFSFSSTKLPHYVIYGYTPLFILLGIFIKEHRSSFWVYLPLLTLFIILLFLPEIALLLKPTVNDGFAAAIIDLAQNYFSLAYRLYFLLGIIILIACTYFYQKLNNFFSTLILGVLTVIAVNFFVVPTYASLTQQPIKEAALFAKKHQLEIIMYKMDTPSFIFYSEKFIKRTKPKAGDYVLTKINIQPQLQNCTTVFQKNAIVLCKIERK